MDLLNEYLGIFDWELLAQTSFRLLFIVVVAWFFRSFLDKLLGRLKNHLDERAQAAHEPRTEYAKRIETLILLVRQGGIVVLWLVVGLVVLKEVGVEIAPILASAGIVGLCLRDRDGLQRKYDAVVTLLEEVGRELKQNPVLGPMILEEPEIFGVDKLENSAVVIKGRIKTVPIEQWKVGREFLRRVKQAFGARGIEIPLPHQTIYFGEASKLFAVHLLERKKRAENSGKTSSCL